MAWFCGWPECIISRMLADITSFDDPFCNGMAISLCAGDRRPGLRDANRDAAVMVRRGVRRRGAEGHLALHDKVPTRVQRDVLRGDGQRIAAKIDRHP